MTNKAYIVANEQQEMAVLEKLEEKGALWQNGEKAVNFIPFRTFPYVIYCNGDKFISWDKLYDLDVDKIIVFDGRNEEHMSEKYVVSQEFMDGLEDWKDNLKSYDDINNYFVRIGDLRNLPILANLWASDRHITNKEHNNRLIAIIRWVNGEDVFEVEKPKKWVVRYKETDCEEISWYIFVVDRFNFNHIINVNDIEKATEFDTKEEAESWANSHQEVVEV